MPVNICPLKGERCPKISTWMPHSNLVRHRDPTSRFDLSIHWQSSCKTKREVTQLITACVISPGAESGRSRAPPPRGFAGTAIDKQRSGHIHEHSGYLNARPNQVGGALARSGHKWPDSRRGRRSALSTRRQLTSSILAFRKKRSLHAKRQMPRRKTSSSASLDLNGKRREASDRGSARLLVKVRKRGWKRLTDF
jgi:hypothetical protein